MEANHRYRLDASVWRSPDGRTLIGGSDFTIVGLSDSNRDALDAMIAGSHTTAIDDDEFTRFLLNRNLVQPVSPPARPSEVALVIPCRDHHAQLDDLLGELDPTVFAEIIVVDDGSSPPLVVPPNMATLVRHEESLGSGAARNTGWRETTAALVLFLDADVATDGRWIPDAVPFLLHPNVAALAPRVRSIPNPSRAGRWEQVRPALDLGNNRSVVRPRTRVPYVPTAALLLKREALESIGGFDASMPLGEDVDLVWRLHDEGWTVRYEPDLAVGHRPRPTARAWIRQRMTYGRSNVALSLAHPAHVAGIELTWWNVAPLLMLARSRPLKAVGLAAGSAGVLMLRDRLIDRCEHPGVMALRLQRDGIAYTAFAVTQAARRNYWPLALLASVLNKRSRWLLTLSLLAPSWEWLHRRPNVPIHEWMAASITDDVSFGTGLWLESIRTRTLSAVRVHLSPIERYLPDVVPDFSRR